MAFADQVALRQQLFEKDPQFARLEREHQEYEDKLQQLAEVASQRHYLSPEEQQAELILKKKKLHCRDKMEELLAQYRPRNN